MADELLRALGARQADPPPGLGDDPSAGSEEVRALLRPLAAEERAALLDGVFAELDDEDGAQDGDGEAAPAVEAAPAIEAAPAVEATPAAVVDLAARRRARNAWLGAAVAVAAAVVLWVGASRTSTTSGSTLPPYAATRLDGGTAAMRSGDSQVPASLTLAPDASIDWVFTPRSPVRTAVGAVLLVRASGQPPRLVPVPRLEVSEQGAVRIAGRLSEIVELSPGTWSLTVLLGDAAALPRSVEETEGADTWSRVSFEVKISVAP